METKDTKAEFKYVGELRGHEGWVTSLAITDDPDVLISASRDRTIIKWRVSTEAVERKFTGHLDSIQDISVRENTIISGSWDRTIQSWDLATGKMTKRFLGHHREVLSVSHAPGNTFFSGSKDGSIKRWDIRKGVEECSKTSKDGGHNGWVTCVRTTPFHNLVSPLLVTSGFDKLIKVWDIKEVGNLKQISTSINKDFTHNGTINTFVISPDGSLCSSGGADNTIRVWDFFNTHLLWTCPNLSKSVHSLVYCPIRYWLCCASGCNILVWDLESKLCIFESKAPTEKEKSPECISLVWNSCGSHLFGGFTDNSIRIWQAIL